MSRKTKTHKIKIAASNAINLNHNIINISRNNAYLKKVFFCYCATIFLKQLTILKLINVI